MKKIQIKNNVSAQYGESKQQYLFYSQFNMFRRLNQSFFTLEMVGVWCKKEQILVRKVKNNLKT